MKSLDLYADPACPWSWLAVRWLTSVAPHRDVRLTFRSYSLWLHDGPAQAPGLPDFLRAVAVAASKESLRVLRVFEALRDAGRADAIERLYLEWGSRVFVPGPPQAPTTAVLEEALAAAGLESAWLAAADDPQWDAVIEASNAALSSLSGGTTLVPTLSSGQQTLFRGAVVSAPLSLEDGLEIWDALEILTAEPAFVGLAPSPLPMPSFAVDNSRGDSAKSAKLVG
ncbi:MULTISPECIES: DsbA family protein [unclassified Kribbella]|uniref:DsbA family protein n=1 Tax=unclassified Kribbella TaxID=2644121 RepID=UPI00301919A2